MWIVCHDTATGELCAQCGVKYFMQFCCDCGDSVRYVTMFRSGVPWVCCTGWCKGRPLRPIWGALTRAAFSKPFSTLSFRLTELWASRAQEHGRQGGGLGRERGMGRRGVWGTQDFWASQFHQHTCFWPDFYLIFVCLDHWDCLFKKCLNAKNLVFCEATDVFKSFLTLITPERPVCNPHILCIGQKSEIRSESGICRQPLFGMYYKLSLSWANSYLDLILLESHFA